MDTFLYLPILSYTFLMFYEWIGAPIYRISGCEIGSWDSDPMAEPGGEDQHSPWPQWKRPVLGAEICWHHGTSRHSTSGFQEKCGKIANKSCPTRAPRQPVSTKKLNVSLPRSFVQDFHAFEFSLSVYLRFHPFHCPFTILSPGRSIHGPLPSSCCRDTMPKSKASRT